MLGGSRSQGRAYQFIRGHTTIPYTNKIPKKPTKMLPDRIHGSSLRERARLEVVGKTNLVFRLPTDARANDRGPIYS